MRPLALVLLVAVTGCPKARVEQTIVEFADFIPDGHSSDELAEACEARHLASCQLQISHAMDDSDSVSPYQLATAFMFACDVGDGESCFWFARAIEDHVIDGPIRPEETWFIYAVGCQKGYQPACDADVER